MANSFRTGHLLSLHFSFWLPGQPGPHKRIKPRPDLVQLLCPPSQNKSFENGRRPKNSRPRCLQQFALITILFSLSTKPKQSLYLYEHFMDDNISYFSTRTCSFNLYLLHFNLILINKCLQGLDTKQRSRPQAPSPLHQDYRLLFRPQQSS